MCRLGEQFFQEMHVETFVELHADLFHRPDMEEPEGFVHGETVGVAFGDAGDDRMQTLFVSFF